MDDICEQCGAPYPNGASHCPACGTPIQLSAETDDDDPAAQLTRTLLFQARTYQQRGDLANAIKCAGDALAIRPTCSTIHTFLGSLYEQQGEHAAAQLHFKKALTVTLTPDEECDIPLLPLRETAPRSTTGGWMLPVLVGCMVFSGLAALFTLWPGNSTVSISGSLPYPRVLPKLPVPGPVNIKPSARESVTPIADKGQSGITRYHETAPLPRDYSDGTATTDSIETEVIGPSAAEILPIMSATPTAEQADAAYAGGSYERAAAIYEKVLANQDKVPPRIHQYLALSYHRLGNINKAEHHMGLAVDGYQQALNADPQNNILRQELQSCQALLESLRAGGDSIAP